MDTKNWFDALTVKEQMYLLQDGNRKEDINSQEDFWVIVDFMAAMHHRFSPAWYDLIARLSEVETKKREYRKK